ncbi:helix-turn-helix transcriptional regulator [Kineosporia sp. NBRC 101677]|uniref:helix-turn-helix transcriptional regulator n=1 Tax=Kineosporia sp. NBRC 101677 TaxID=3032197 RepID=UPI00332A24E5
MDRTEFGSFLRARREALRPEDVGLTPGPRRRALGLRREEVAQLAAMSVDYYARLEQGRGPQPSPSMLTVIARVLRLTLDERDHLYRLAGHAPPDRLSGTTHVVPGLQRVLDRINDTPAFILSDLGETLSQNTCAESLFGDPTTRTGRDRYAAHRWFTHPETEQVVYPEGDRARQSRALVAQLRIARGRRGPRSEAAGLIRSLQRSSPEFARIWALQEVARRFEDHETLIHPELGAITFDCQALFTEDQSQTLVVLTVAPRSADAAKLELLGAFADIGSEVGGRGHSEPVSVLLR